MRRFYGLLVLLLASLPFSAGVAGCKHAVAPDYCPGFSDSGPVGGQATSITFSSNLTTSGESLNFGQIGSGLSASATDCFGTAVTISAYTYGTSNMSIADINPTTGSVCAGTWNRNTGGGVADYSVCTPPATQPTTLVAYVTASAAGVTSNPIPIYVHPVVTDVAVGAATSAGSCSVTTALTGAVAAGSNVVTLIPPVNGSVPALTVGQGLSGTGIPAGTTITSITPGASGTEILNLLYSALSSTSTTVMAATTTGSNSVTLLPATSTTVMGVTVAGSNTVTLLPTNGAVPTVVVGQSLSGAGIPAGTTITAVTSQSNGTVLLTLLNAATVTSTSSSPTTLTVRGAVPTVTVGQVLSGTGIAPGTTITAATRQNDGTVLVTLLYAATATSTSTNPATLTATSPIAFTASVADPSSNCCPANASLVTTSVGTYNGLSCVSQSQTAQLVARVYSNGDTQAIHNITCQVGHITFSPQTSSNVVTIDANGIATAVQPGSTTILASASNAGSGSTAGFFSTCPPKSITLSVAGSTTPPTAISVAQNNLQTFNTTVLDTNGNTITGLPLEFVSTSPQTLAVGSNSVTPNFPGAGTISAICQPASCNPSPFSQIGYLGNGKPITSNGITINTAGTSGNQVIVGSTNSQFFYSVDFTTASTGALYKLPYTPNSLVSTVDGSTLYLGSTNVLMSVSTANLAVSTIAAIPGVVLAVSPDGSTLVIADPTRGVTSLYSNAGSLESTYNGVGVRAQWSPDSSTVYIAAGNTMLVHSTFTGWTSTPIAVNYQDVAVAVPAYGAYFAGGTDAEGRSYCATSTGAAPVSPPPAVVNTFYPLAQTDASPLQRVASTNDGMHVLGEGFATTGGTTVANLYDLAIAAPANSTDQRLACTTDTAGVTFATTDTTKPLPIPAGSTFNGVVPAPNSAIAFVNYFPASAATATDTLPFYFPATGTLSSIKLSGTATGPLAGVFSSDSKTFYTSTTGDNALHIIAINGTTVTDSSTIPLNLTDLNGNITVPNLIAARVKKSLN